MIGLNRRHILTGAVAATAAAASSPLAATPAHAAAPLTGKQAPSFYRLKVGEFEVTVVNDGARAIPLPATFVRNVSNEQVLAAAEAAYMPKGSIVAPFNPMVVNTGAKLVLIDTGYGPGLGPTVGLLPSTLAAAGVDPKSIDIVLISHMHGDHVLGLKTPDGALAFPNAEIKVPAVDWTFWMDDENMSRAPEGFAKATFGFNRKIFSDLTDKVTRYQWGQEVAPGITAVEFQGPYAWSHIVPHHLGVGAPVLSRRRHQCPGLVSAQSGLAGHVRQRSGESRTDAPAHLRHGCSRKITRVGLPLPVPRDRLHREGGNRLSVGAGSLEPGDLSFAHPRCHCLDRSARCRYSHGESFPRRPTLCFRSCRQPSRPACSVKRGSSISPPSRRCFSPAILVTAATGSTRVC